MAALHFCFSLFLLAALLPATLATRKAGSIGLFTAGWRTERIRTLEENSCLPDTYYTLRCEVPFGAKPGPMKIFINGAYYSTRYYPYFISRKRGGYTFRIFLPATRRVHITCRPSRGAQFGVTVYRHCGARKQPKRQWKPKKRVWKNTKNAWKPKKRVRNRTKRVWKNTKNAWKRRKASNNKPKRTANKPWDKSGCVVIPFWKVKYVNKGWVKNSYGITYKPGDKFEGVVKGFTSDIKFPFWVPKKGRYAVTLDMTTKHWTEHNDAWLRFENGGFQLRRFHRMRRASGHVKAYHNKNGRSIAAYSVDFDPHSFSTNKKLRPGKKYEMIVGARSTQWTLHRIIMFPCDGRQCEYNSAYWKRYVKTCSR